MHKTKYKEIQKVVSKNVTLFFLLPFSPLHRKKNSIPWVMLEGFLYDPDVLNNINVLRDPPAKIPSLVDKFKRYFFATPNFKLNISGQ